MARVSTKFEVRGIEPADDPAWASAGERVHRDFWRAVVVFTREEFEFERARGRDRLGRLLKPISRHTRAHRKSAMGPADANAPPLTPADAASRTVAYLDGRAFATHAEFFWRNNWGRILHFHRVGAKNRLSPTGRLPVRDVIGLSKASTAKIDRKAKAWWAGYKRAHPDRTKPPEKPPPAAAAAAEKQALAREEERLGIKFRHQPGLGSEYRTVVVDVKKLDAQLARNKTQYVGPAGAGGIEGRYQAVGRFLERAKKEKTPVDQPRVFLDASGIPDIGDGRHRWAWLRDHGARVVPVSVRRAVADAFRRLFGVAPKPIAKKAPKIEVVAPGQRPRRPARTIQVYEDP